jgi:hypothetical protein
MLFNTETIKTYLSIYDELSEKDDIVGKVSVNYSALPSAQKHRPLLQYRYVLYVRDGSMDAECERAFPLVFGLADYYQNTVKGNVLSGE